MFPSEEFKTNGHHLIRGYVDTGAIQIFCAKEKRSPFKNRVPILRQEKMTKNVDNA